MDSLVHQIREPRDSVTSPVVLAQELAIFFASAGEEESASYWVREAFELSPIGVDHRLLRSTLFTTVMGDRAFQRMVADRQGEAYPRVRAEADRLRRAGAIP